MNKSQYKNSGEWRKACPKDYAQGKRNGVLNDICEYFGWELPKKIEKKPNGYWDNKNRVLAEAKKYKTRGEWSKKSPGSYKVSKKHGWYEEATTHMVFRQKSRGYWDIKENVLAEANKYNTIRHWSKKSPSSYQAAKRNGWYEECTEHMVSKQKSRGYWDIKENVLVEARKYKTKIDWSKKSPSSYQAAKRNGWYEECTEHMVSKQKPHGYWDIKENVLAEARKYKTKIDWLKNSASSYQAAKRNGWFEEAKAHMKKRK